MFTRSVAFRLVTIVAMLLMTIALPYSSLAVHDDNFFELGGIQAADILGDGIVANGPDWADLFDANGNLVAGALATFGGADAEFLKDDLSQKGPVDRTTFSGAGGSNKNNDPISAADCAARTPPLTGSACDTWHWDEGNVPTKDDLANVYAYAKFNPANNHLLIYAGFERLDPSGDSHIDVEFLQSQVALDEAVPCNDPGPDVTPCAFTGIRTVGDVIISMDYLVGGSIGSVSVHSWNGTEYIQVGTATGEGCNLPADTICAFNNGGDINGGPWDNFGKGGDVITLLPQNAFTEFGVDVTALLGSSPCLTTFMGKTRSSASFTAELKDFAGPHSFNVCGAQISIAPSAVNAVGQSHTFTVTASKTFGGVASPASNGTIVNVTLTAANGAVVSNKVDNCASPGTVGGTCTVTFTSNSAGTVTGHAAADIAVNGLTFHRETDGQSPNSGDAVKRFVDAKISIGPDDTNSIGESHTFTVAVQQDDGLSAAQGGDGVTGFAPAPDGTKPTVTLTDSGGAVNNISSNTCANPGTSSGTCSVTFTSNTAGTVTGHATVTFSVSGVSLTRATDSTHGSSGDATKVFVAGSLAWFKNDNAGQRQGGATFEVCRTHNFNTADSTFTPITPVCVTVLDNNSPDADADAGEFLLTALRLGRYTVHETVAPPGFVPDPDTVTVDLTLNAPNATISEAFVNQRPILKLSEFGYVNAPTGTPTSGVVSGTTTYTVKIKNFGGAAADFSGNLAVTTNSGSGTLSCTGGNTKTISGTNLAPNAEQAFTLACTYASLADGSTVTANLSAITYTTNGLTRTASGTPASIVFTVQSD